jgi:uncharacterized protein (TIGR03663 family)
MNPQPPVTRMRMAARTSSAERSALAESAPAVARVRDYVEQWKARFAETDWVPWLILVLAAFLRFFLLGIKPPHFDEGINGWFVDQMVHNGFYKYDPTNYHGPLHFYVLFLSQTLLGRNLWALRLPVVLVSIGSVWLTLKFELFFGRPISRLAALAMAVSPGFVFYGRYSIHEVWILFFTMLFFFGFFGVWRFGTADYLWLGGMGLTGMILSKETYILHVACALIAVVVCYASTYLSRVENGRPVKQIWTAVDLAMVAGTAVALLVFFYSGTFFHWNGVKGLYQAYKPWLETGTQGHGHEKPPYYWLELIARYEWPVLAGLVACIFAARFKNLFLRYLAIYGVGTLMAYSIVKYKTPWCIISFIWPFLFVFGAAVLLVAQRLKALPYLVSAMLMVVSFGYCAVLNYFRCTTDTEPYVYVQTYNDIFKFTDPLLTLARHNPLAYQMTGHIIRASPYPLPWTLGDFAHVGYYEPNNTPNPVDGDFLLVQQDRIAPIEAQLHGRYYTVPLTIRAYQEPSKAYFSAKYFSWFFPDREPDFVGKPAATPAPQAQPTPSP